MPTWRSFLTSSLINRFSSRPNFLDLVAIGLQFLSTVQKMRGAWTFAVNTLHAPCTLIEVLVCKQIASLDLDVSKVMLLCNFMKSTPRITADLPGRSSRPLLQYFINLNSAPLLLLQTRLVDHKCPCTE